jgi:hypothetical protein
MDSRHRRRLRRISGAAIAAGAVMAGVLMAASQERGRDAVPADVVRNEMLVTFRPGVSDTEAGGIIKQTGAEIVGAPMVAGRIFHIRVPDQRRYNEVERQLRASSAVQATEPVQVVKIPPGENR